LLFLPSRRVDDKKPKQSFAVRGNHASLQQENEGKDFSSGDILECQNCHEANNYDALMDVTAEEGEALVADYAKREIKKF